MSIALAAMVSLSACDGSEEADDAERFLGSWSLVAVSDDDGDKLSVFQASFDAFGVTFSGVDAASISVEPADPNDPDVTVNGTYTVNTSTTTLSVTIDANGVPLTIPFVYEFESDNRVRVTTNSIPLNVAFGTTLVGNATITLAAS